MLHITKRVYDLPDEQKYVHILTEITTGKIPETRLSEDWTKAQTHLKKSLIRPNKLQENHSIPSLQSDIKWMADVQQISR